MELISPNWSLLMQSTNPIEKVRESPCILPSPSPNTSPKNTMPKSTSKDKICKPFEASRSEEPLMHSDHLLSNKKNEVLSLPVPETTLKVSLTAVTPSKSREPSSCLPSLQNLKSKVYKDSEANGLILSWLAPPLMMPSHKPENTKSNTMPSLSMLLTTEKLSRVKEDWLHKFCRIGQTMKILITFSHVSEVEVLPQVLWAILSKWLPIQHFWVLNLWDRPVCTTHWKQEKGWF